MPEAKEPTSPHPSQPATSEESKEIPAMPTAQQSNGGSFKLMLLCLMVLQNSSVVILGRWSMAGKPAEDKFDVSHFVMITEVVKLILSAMLEFHATSGYLWQSIQTNILADPLDALKISVPAILYLIQNTLLYVALGNLSAPLFQVTYQSKLVTTAIVSVILLQRRYKFQQWICLFGISFGVATVILGEKAQKADPDAEDKGAQGNLKMGLIAVSIACFSSAFAGVYFEKVLKKATTRPDGTPKPPVSMWMRNIQLAFFSVAIAVLKDIFDFKGDTAEESKPFFHGFDTMACILILLQAAGGLLVAAVIKYADNVLKGLATGVSVIVATLVSIPVFGQEPTMQFALGSGLILSSVYFFSNDLPCVGKMKAKEENAKLLPR